MAKKKGVKKKAAARTAKGKADGKAKGPPLRVREERKRYKQKLPVAVGHDVVEKAGLELGKLHRKVAATLDERRKAMSAFKETLAGYKSRMDELSDTLNNSTALADVPCVEYLIVETNEIEVVRLDTGEVVPDKNGKLTRPATVADRQQQLALDAAAAKATGDDEDDDTIEAGDLVQGTRDARAGDGG